MLHATNFSVRLTGISHQSLQPDVAIDASEALKCRIVVQLYGNMDAVEMLMIDWYTVYNCVCTILRIINAG